MKTIGLIGGLSPESTAHYYTGLNKGMQARLGGHHSAKIILSSLDFQEFIDLKAKDDWDTQGDIIVHHAKILDGAGADFIALSTNTMHMFADRIREAVDIPFLHIGDATAKRIISAGFNKIALLGTRYTMEKDFYKGRLEAHGIQAIIPDAAGIQTVHDVIYDELCHGLINPDSRVKYIKIINELVRKGAQGVILGCTEIQMLIGQKDLAIPVFDTTEIHIEEILDMALR